MELLVNLHDQIGESPLWSSAENALWWVDIEGRRLHRYDWASRQHRTWETPERFSSLALVVSGGLLAAGEASLFRVSVAEDGRMSLRVVATVDHPYDNMRFNDGRTDRAGTFYVTTLQMDRSGTLPSGSLYRYGGDVLEGPILGGLITANGIAFSPDNRFMYLCDSHPTVQRIWRFERNPDGTLLNRREFVDMTSFDGRPDGATIDADGCYWICATGGGQVLRFDPLGRLDRSIKVPVSRPTMCTFAGPELDCLVVTSMRPQNDHESAAGDSGAVFVARPGVRGLPEAASRPTGRSSDDCYPY